MSKPESGTEFEFYLKSWYEEMGRRSNEVFVIKKMKNGLKAPKFGEPLEGDFTRAEKESLENLLKKVQQPGFRS